MDELGLTLLYFKYGHHFITRMAVSPHYVFIHRLSLEISSSCPILLISCLVRLRLLHFLLLYGWVRSTADLFQIRLSCLPINSHIATVRTLLCFKYDCHVCPQTAILPQYVFIHMLLQDIRSSCHHSNIWYNSQLPYANTMKLSCFNPPSSFKCHLLMRVTIWGNMVPERSPTAVRMMSQCFNEKVSYGIESGFMLNPYDEYICFETKIIHACQMRAWQSQVRY